jgi:hypothetical protein
MKVDVVDMGDPVLGNHRANIARDYSDGIFKMYPMSNGIVQMADEVYNFVSASGSLNVLRIWGHGWAGGQLIAAGADSQSGVNNASALWGPNIDTYSYYIAKLGELFAADGRIELKGCSVAQGTDGERFLIKIAVVLGYPVQASSVVQGGPGNSFAEGVGWNGQVVEATPDYTIKYIQGSSL